MDVSERPAVAYFRHEGNEFTIVHASNVQFLPPIPNSDPSYNLRGRELRRAIWVVDRCPELAYMLKSYHSESSFLAGVQVNAQQISLLQRGNRWVLDPAVVEAWSRLESNLLHVCDALLQDVAIPEEYCFPFDAFWPNPSDCGYKKEWGSAHGARVAAYRSLDACRVLLARCTMAVALASPDLCARPPRWVKVLLQKKVPPQWVEFFQASLVADLSPGLRVGAYISPAQNDAGTKWIRHIPCLVRANIPVYIYWPRDGRDQILGKFPFLRDYLPVPELIVNVAASEKDNCFFWKPTSRGTAATQGPRRRGDDAAPTPAPEVPHGVGQRPGESSEAFFARREQVNALREAHETEEQRQSRLARVQQAASFARPTRKSRTTVYLWTTVGDHDPTVPEEWFELHYRELVGHARLFEMWELYPQQHKRYDAFHDEWDICPWLAPDVEPLLPGADDDDDDSVYDSPLESTQAVEQAEVQSGPSLLQSFASDLQVIYEDDTVAVTPVFDSLAIVARQAWGLTPRVVEDVTIAYDEYPPRNVLKMLGYYGEAGEDHALMKSLSGLITSLESNQEHPDASGYIWDLASSSYDYLACREHETIRIEQVTLNSSLWYRCSYRDDVDAPGWTLIVKHAATALELYRRQDICTTRAAGVFLARRGIPLRTIIPAPPASTWPEHRYYWDLGVRPSGYQFTYDDYRAYEYRVRSGLPRAKLRAAMLYGGLVWRLAMSILGEDPAVLVCEEPNTALANVSERFRASRGDDWIDDAVTPEEIDLICGVVRVYNGKCSRCGETQVRLIPVVHSRVCPNLRRLVVAQGEYLGRFACRHR